MLTSCSSEGSTSRLPNGRLSIDFFANSSRSCESEKPKLRTRNTARRSILGRPTPSVPAKSRLPIVSTSKLISTFREEVGSGEQGERDNGEEGERNATAFRVEELKTRFSRDDRYFRFNDLISLPRRSSVESKIETTEANPSRFSSLLSVQFNDVTTFRRSIGNSDYRRVSYAPIKYHASATSAERDRYEREPPGFPLTGVDRAITLRASSRYFLPPCYVSFLP